MDGERGKQKRPGGREWEGMSNEDPKPGKNREKEKKSTRKKGNADFSGKFLRGS